MKNKLFNLLAIIIIGGLSGIFASQLFLPWLAGFPFFKNIDWISRSREGVTIINRTEQTVVAENEALTDAVGRVEKISVAVIAQATEKIVNKKTVALAQPETVASNSGFIVSSDGLVLTSTDSAPESAQKFLVITDGKQDEAQVVKRDAANGVVLLKISETNLPVLPFAENELKLGQGLFLVGAKLSNLTDLAAGIDKFIDSGIIKQVSPSPMADFINKGNTGSPVFNIKGEVVGIIATGVGGQPKIVLSAVLKELLK